MLNVAFYLDATAARAPGATAVVYKGRRYSYAQLHRLANQVANGLAAAGYGAGDRLAVCCSNRPGFIPVYYGILKTGATAVVLSDTLSPRDLAYELEDSEAKALFVYDRKEDLAIGEDAAGIARLAPTCDDLWVIPADPLAPSTIAGCAALSDLIDGQATDFGTVGFDESETAVVLYTSGPTGRPCCSPSARRRACAWSSPQCTTSWARSFPSTCRCCPARPWSWSRPSSRRRPGA